MGAPSIRSRAILLALAAHPGGLTTPQVEAIADPGPDPGPLCYMILRRYERRGIVFRAGQSAARGRAVTWRLTVRPALAGAEVREEEKLSEKRLAVKREIALTQRRVALAQREIAALAKIEEGIEELEQADREIAALDLGCAAELQGGTS